MKIEKTWTASSKPEDSEKSDELVRIAGQWGIGIEVSITKPYIYSKGPVYRQAPRFGEGDAGGQFPYRERRI